MASPWMKMTFLPVFLAGRKVGYYSNPAEMDSV